MTDHAEDLALARRLACLAADIALGFRGKPGDVRIKDDGTPVGEADFAIDAEWTAVLQAERPDDAILSEESGETGRGRRRWLLDPLDGTSMFVDDYPGWGSLVTLQDGGESVMSLITRPLEGRCWWAIRDGGAYAGELAPEGAGELLHVSERTMSQARVSVWGDMPSSMSFRGLPSSPPSAEVELLSALDGWVPPNPDSVLRLAEGEVDAVVSLGGLVWDHAPAVLLVEEASGAFRDRSGGQRLDLLGGVYSNAHLSAPIGEMLGWYPE